MTKVREVVCVGLEQLGGMRSVGRGLWASEDGHLWRIDHRVEGHNPERNAFAINGEARAGLV